MQFFIIVFLFNLNFFCIITLDVPIKFNITIKTPGNNLSPTKASYKSIHVKYTSQRDVDECSIVGIEPFISTFEDNIQQMTAHLCQTDFKISQQNKIWYDDETNCRGTQSMLIYQWTSDFPLSTFRIPDDMGFYLNKSNSIVLTVTYSEEQQSHSNQLGLIIYLSTAKPRFYVGTILVGNEQGDTRFSCRSTTSPRLLYAVKPLFTNVSNSWWRIYAIRNRSFSRKSIQSVLDSTIFSKQNQTDIELISTDAFLLSGDYILIECAPIAELNCKFLIYYTYKNLQENSFDENNSKCENNLYPNLFKLLPRETTNQTIEISSRMSNIDGSTIFLVVGLLLFIIWISIIIGCVIMRRVRGLVNFRSVPNSPYSDQKTNPLLLRKGAANDQKMAATAEHIGQLDAENTGLTT